VSGTISSLPTSNKYSPLKIYNNEGVDVLVGLGLLQKRVIFRVNSMDETKRTNTVGLRELGKAHGDLS
jgi:hypothetical protein